MLLLLLVALFVTSAAVFAPSSKAKPAAKAAPLQSETAAMPAAQGAAPATAPASAAPAADKLMPTVSADLRGHRTDLQVRQGYAERLLHETDLAALARELVALAATGDGAAAAALSQLYFVCAGDVERRLDGPTRCQSLGAEPGPALAAKLRAASKAWHQLARRLGDPASVLRVDYYETPLPGVPPTAEELRMRDAATALFADGDYDALLDATLMLHELSDRYDHRAFEWALCTVRPACPSARPQCRNGNRCMLYDQAAAPDFNQLTPRQSRVIIGQQAEIVRALQRGDIDVLWRPLDLGEGG